jgi:hypothetical protein
MYINILYSLSLSLCVCLSALHCLCTKSFSKINPRETRNDFQQKLMMNCLGFHSPDGGGIGWMGENIYNDIFRIVWFDKAVS